MRKRLRTSGLAAGKRLNKTNRSGAVKKIRILLIVLFSAGLLYGGFPYFHAVAATAVAPTECSKELIEQAERRMVGVYDAAVSSPIRLCLEKPFLGISTTHGTSRFAPFLPTVNIIGPEGMNVDVVAHEWAHSEIANQSSFITRNYRLPTWFDEGLAMQVDFRPEFSTLELNGYIEDQDLKVPTLEEMATAKQFFKPGRQGTLHYALARCVIFDAVQSARRKHPNAAKIDLLTGLIHASFKKPEEFESAYQACVSDKYAKSKNEEPSI